MKTDKDLQDLQDVTMVDESILTIIRNYMKVLSDYGINTLKAVLYESFMRGDAHEWSDIDLVIIAPEFDGKKDREQIKDMWRATLKADNRIEPIPCGVKEWEEDESRPIIDIARRVGIAIYN